MQHDSEALTVFLKKLEDADAAAIASGAVATLRRIDAALCPIIGSRGVDALFRRSLHLARAQFSWLPAATFVSDGVHSYPSLQAVLAVRPAAQALAGYSMVLQGFLDLLANLIGEALTERLLRSVWNHPSSGDAVQDRTR